MMTDEELKYLSDNITTFIPKHLMNDVWSAYKQIKETNEPQPCSCKSSGALWLKAINTIREYVERK